MICFSCLVPYSPEFIFQNNEENLKIKKTTQSLEKISLNLKEAQPEVLLIISPSSYALKDAFTLNLSQNYKSNFKLLGDLKTKIVFNGDLELSYRIKERFETKMVEEDESLILTTQPDLEQNFSIPLLFFSKKYHSFSLIPISPCSLSFQKHFEFGKKLREELVLTNKKIAVIASVNLLENSFEKNKNIVKLIKDKDFEELFKLNSELKSDISSILILLGILNNSNYKIETLFSQNHYFTAKFNLI